MTMSEHISAERDWITIDGSLGEGGGQIVRTSLSLSCITGRPIRMINVRAGRPRPGLANQHLTAIRAAQDISEARVDGAILGSRGFTFEPNAVRAGEYSFDVGTAGSTTLVLQTITLPLALTSGNSQVSIVGGTHNPMAPCYEYLEVVWGPLLALLGVHVQLRLKRAGFYPVGGGRIEAGVASAIGMGLRGCDLIERGGIISVDGFSAVARLPRAVAERQACRAEARLKAAGIRHLGIDIKEIGAASPGTVLFLHCRCRETPAAFFALGARGRPAERVADEAVDQLIEFTGGDQAVDPHAADQLVLPMALARGPSSFTTTRVTEHLRSHIDLLHQFLERPIKLLGRTGEAGRIEVE